MNAFETAMLRVGIKNSIIVKYACSIESENGHLLARISNERLSSLLEKGMYCTIQYLDRQIKGRILNITGGNTCINVAFQPMTKKEDL